MREEIQRSIRALGLASQPVCVHASLRSFGYVEGGAQSVVDAMLAEGCTVLVPTFSTATFEIYPDPDDPIAQIERNGWGHEPPTSWGPGASRIYSPDVLDVDRDMGAIPAAVLATRAHVRGMHPLDSFTAVGPLAHSLIAGQRVGHVYAPLEALAAADGCVVLMGVGLERLTLLHLAEQRAGRSPFIRWANGPGGRIMQVDAGGCSEGFQKLAPALAGITATAHIGRSQWTILSTATALEAAAAAIRADPSVTRCNDPLCERCRDAMLGGPRRMFQDL